MKGDNKLRVNAVYVTVYEKMGHLVKRNRFAIFGTIQ
jgi:hypothetical protein